MKLVKVCDGTVDITPLLKAFRAFSSGIKEAQTQLERDGVFQRFEFTFELLWKTTRRILEYRGVAVDANPRSVFREAHIQKIIDAPEYWFQMLKYRNLTTYTYSEEFTTTLFPEFPKIAGSMASLIEDLKRL